MKKRLCILFLLVLVLLGCTATTAFALEESEVQAQVDAVGKEAVTGNVLIWFLCAIAFLKISQKIDSFLSSLGLNVGHTGGSMLTEMMIAARSLGGRGSSSGSPSRPSGSSGSGGTFSGGLAGIVSRHVTSSAAKSVTTSTGGTSGNKGGIVGSSMYASSVAKGGTFANKVIGAVAHGNVASMGTITGDKATEAMNTYMGITAMGPGAGGVPSYSNVEIGGGRITGRETSSAHPDGIDFGMYSTEQYMAPEGEHTIVHTADGASWYKQYAQDAVKKTPYLAPDGKVAYQEAILKKLPPMPKRKDRV